MGTGRPRRLRVEGRTAMQRGPWRRRRNGATQTLAAAEGLAAAPTGPSKHRGKAGLRATAYLEDIWHFENWHFRFRGRWITCDFQQENSLWIWG